ncbi:MAG: PKD domain-containing protein [Saprospiraceae bacterium]
MDLRKLLSFFFALTLFYNLYAQSATGVDLSKKFKNYQIVQLPSDQLYNQLVSQRSDAKQMTLQNWDLTLFDSEIISPHYTARIATASGIKTEKAPTIAPMNGYTRWGGRVSLTFADNFIYGYIEDGDKTFFIEPLYHQTRQASTNQFIIYELNDIIDDEVHTCATDSPAKLGIHEHEHNEDASRLGLCYEVEYSIANDFLMFQAYGNSNGVQNHAIGVLNNVQTNYDDEFQDELSFIIVEQFVSSCATCDPWTSSTNAEVLLNSFTNWAPGGFAVSHDIGSIWTDRDFDGSTIGIAWVGAVCTPVQYNALQDFSTNANLKRVMVAHEIGHNFDASHDPQGNPNIMAPAVQNTTTWSTASKTDIQNYYNSINCLDFCASVAAPQANFTYTVTAECEPGIVQFTNQSTGTITQYQWQFPGGVPSTSTQQNPVVNYPSAGVYSVTLTVSNGPFSDQLELIDEITILPIPEANFTTSINGAEVEFTNTSQAGPNAIYSWNFGDGNTSNDENPVHTYTQDGSYTVVLTIDDICGFDSRTKIVVVATPPVANFAANPTSGCGSFSVNFTNTSSPNATIYDWEFPGGSPASSILPNPVVTYSTPGNYPVTLTASNAQGSNTKTIANYISVKALPTSAFSYTQTGQTFAFTSQATNATSHLWNFGDGNASNQINPTHTYTSSGMFTVTLITANGNCPTASSSQSVNASTAPISSFSTAANVGCAPFTAAFTNTSSNNPTGIEWHFPGGQPATSTLFNPTVEYDLPGSYDVTLITTNLNGSDTLTLDDYIVVNTVPAVSFAFSNSETTFNFVNTGSGATSFNWAFGDGNTSNQENPSHTYATEGNYTVNFSAANACGSVNTSQSIAAFNIPGAQPANNSSSAICKGNTVSFSDQSTGTITQRQWIFEGGSPSTSNLADVTVLYNTAGTYDVTLIVGNVAGSDTIVLQDIVVVGAEPITVINASPNGINLTLTNGGSNFITSGWLLPNGTTSNQSTVEYQATENGLYTFYLTNTNSCGSTVDSFNFLVTAYPQAIFTTNNTGNVSCAPVTILYTAPNIAGNTYEWTFSGGNPASANTPEVGVSYANAGLYDVSLIVSNTLGSDTLLLQGYLTLGTTPEAEFEHTVTGGQVDFEFSGSSQISVFWDFAGLGTSSDLNPSFDFPASGSYPVTLIASNGCGNDTIVHVVSVVVSSTQNEVLAGLKIYPNPVNNLFYIETNGESQISQIESYNALGQKVRTPYSCQNTLCTINAEQWVAGNYQLMIITEAGQKVVKVVKL